MHAVNRRDNTIMNIIADFVMASKKKAIKRTSIPLNIISASKRYKVTHIKAPVKTFGAHAHQEREIHVDNTAEQHLVDDDYQTGDSTYDELDAQQQTSYVRRKEKAAEKWEIIQDKALDTAFSTMGKPHFTCVSCKESPAAVICHQCGPHTHYCEACAVGLHQYSLFHHHMEIWQVCTCK